MRVTARAQEINGTCRGIVIWEWEKMFVLRGGIDEPAACRTTISVNIVLYMYEREGDGGEHRDGDDDVKKKKQEK